MKKDYYKIMGISENASTEDIKKAYRKLAKQYHPDSHPGDAHAEARFKEISEAYSILSHPERRQKYDQVRKYGGDFNPEDFGGINFDNMKDFHFEWGSPGEGFGSRSDNFGFGDMFSQFFGGRDTSRSTRWNQRVRRGQDIKTDLTISFNVAVLGGKQAFSISVNGTVKSFSVNIKPGIEEGSQIRLKGQGVAGVNSDPGDLILTIHIGPHSTYYREGLNIIYKCKVNLAQILLGTKVTVPTVEGKKVVLQVPAGSQNGQRFRLKGMGIKTKDGRSGDFFVEMEVEIPKKLNQSQKKLIKEFAQVSNMDY